MAKARVALSRKLAYQKLFAGEDGKLVLADLAAAFHLKSTTVTLNDVRPDETIFREGQRSVVLYILSAIKTDKKLIEHLMESIDDEEA